MDAGLRLDDLPERPERDSVAVGQTAALAPGDELGVVLDDPEELVHEAALPDSGNADDGHELRRARGANATEGVAQDSELLIAADEVGTSLVRDVDATTSPRLGRAPDRDRRCLSLRLDGRRLLVLDRVTRGAVRRLVGEDAVDRSRALQASRGVDDVSRGHAFTGFRTCVQPDERLAGGDGDSHLDVVVPNGPVANGQAGAHGTLRVVLMRDRCAEQRHDRIADELLDRAAVAFEL